MLEEKGSGIGEIPCIPAPDGFIDAFKDIERADRATHVDESVVRLRASHVIFDGTCFGDGNILFHHLFEGFTELLIDGIRVRIHDALDASDMFPEVACSEVDIFDVAVLFGNSRALLKKCE